MKRVSLYSRSRPKVAGNVPVEKKIEVKSWNLRKSFRKYRSTFVIALPGIIALIFVLAQWALAHRPVEVTQEDIDAAVAKSLETVPLPSHSAKAYEAVRGSIVRVRAFFDGPDGGEILLDGQ